MTAVFAMIATGSLVLAVLDMGMNGSRNADFAPWGLGITAVCMAGYYLAGGT